MSLTTVLERIDRLEHWSTLSKDESRQDNSNNPIEILKRKHRRQNKDFREIIAGDNGNGKSSLAVMEGCKENPNTFLKQPQWAIDNQLHFFARQWIQSLSFLPKLSVNIYDEPAQSGGHHREFMSEANIVITKTVATARFKKLTIPVNIPFIDMLDIDIRKLCQVYVYCYDQGHAEVFLISNPKFGGDPWYEKIIDEFTWDMPNNELWKIYEKKKFETEDLVYKKYGDKLKKREKDDRSTEEYLDEIHKNRDLCFKDTGKPDVIGTCATLDVGRDKANKLIRQYMKANNLLDTNEK